MIVWLHTVYVYRSHETIGEEARTSVTSQRADLERSEAGLVLLDLVVEVGVELLQLLLALLQAEAALQLLLQRQLLRLSTE